MKRITFSRNPAGAGFKYFWHPWGCLGCLGRTLAFIAALMGLIYLISLLGRCSRNTVDTDVQDIINIGGGGVDPDSVSTPIGEPVPGWPTDIDDPGANLPAPGDNRIPPYDDDDVDTGDDGRRYVTNRLNVIIDADAGDEKIRSWADQFKKLYPSDEYAVVFYDPNTKLLQVSVPPAELTAVMNRLPSQITDISFKVFPEGILGPVAVAVNDPVFKKPRLSWYFKPIQTFDAWRVTAGSPEVKVAVVDSYFDINHDDLKGRIVNPYSVVTRTSNVAPAAGCDEVSFMHGTMVATQAVGTLGNARGTAGIAPGCRLIPVSLGHRVTSMTIIQGVLYAIYQGANVINISMGADFDNSVAKLPIPKQIELSKREGLLEQGVWDYVTQLADKRNVTLVWAAGNENVFTALDPMKRDMNAIRVSAVDENLAKADFSNFGNFPNHSVEASTISAPGVDIFGGKPFNSYDIGPGTSFAAPIVTGAIALMKSLDPTLTNAQIREILQKTGKLPTDGNTSIGPVIQIADALKEVKKGFANYDDVMKNHNLLVGTWQTTQQLTSGKTGENIALYYQISSPEKGAGKIVESETKRVFASSLTIEWSPSLILRSSHYQSPGVSDRYTSGVVKCRPGPGGLLLCEETQDGGSVIKYYLKKIR